MGTLHFKSKSGYMKYNAYRFIHHLNKGGKDVVFIHGKRHKVNHQ